MNSGFPIVVGTDLSAPSLSAIRQAASWAQQEQAPLIVAHVTTRLDVSRPTRDDLRSAVEKHIEPFGAKGAEIVFEEGSPPACLIQLAEKRGAGLLIVGASGGGALKRALFGSTVGSVARYAPCSVLVARPSPEHGPVVVGTDFSDAVTPALEAGRHHAQVRREKLVLIHSNYEPSSPLNLLGPIVVSPPRPSDEDVQERRAAALTTLNSLVAGYPGESECRVVSDDPGTALIDEADQRGASLVVVGTHGRTGFSRIALGSVAEVVAQHAHCSVLIARANPPGGRA